MAFFNGLPNVEIFEKIVCMAAPSCKPPQLKKADFNTTSIYFGKRKTAAFAKPSSGKVYRILTQE